MTAIQQRCSAPGTHLRGMALFHGQELVSVRLIEARRGPLEERMVRMMKKIDAVVSEWADPAIDNRDRRG